MSMIGLPNQAKFYAYEEAIYGEGPSGATYLIADKILDVRLDTGTMHKTLRGISEPSVCAFISQPSDPVLHVEWVFQSVPAPNMSLASHCVTHNSEGSMNSLAFIVGANTEGGTESWYYCNGCVAKNFNISASRGNEYICTADFSVKSVSTTDIYALSTTKWNLAALGTEYAVFNTSAHAIAITGVTAAAYITDSFNVSVDNDLRDYWDCDSATKVAAIPGNQSITGSCDISLDGGGGVHWGDVFGGKPITTIVATLTGTAAHIDNTLTLTSGRFDSTSVDLNISGDGMLSSVPFTFKDIAFS